MPSTVIKTVTENSQELLKNYLKVLFQNIFYEINMLYYYKALVPHRLEVD